MTAQPAVPDAPAGRVLRFRITLPVRVRGDNAGKPYPLSSMNSYASPQVRMGRAKLHRSNAHDQALAVRLLHRLPIATEHRTVRLTLVRGKGQRLLDFDGAVVGLKPILDGIRDAGLLVADSPKWCREIVEQRKDYEAGYVVECEIWPL